MDFKRLNRKYVVRMLDLVLQPQPDSTQTQSNYKISKVDQIDLIAVKLYGKGLEGSFTDIAYKNADLFLAWYLDNTNIDNIDIPARGSY